MTNAQNNHTPGHRRPATESVHRGGDRGYAVGDAPPPPRPLSASVGVPQRFVEPLGIIPVHTFALRELSIEMDHMWQVVKLRMRFLYSPENTAPRSLHYEERHLAQHMEVAYETWQGLWPYGFRPDSMQPMDWINLLNALVRIDQVVQQYAPPYGSIEIVPHPELRTTW